MLYSDTFGEIAQQITNTWGGREWVCNIFSTMIASDVRNLWRLRRWMMEYNKVLVVFNISVGVDGVHCKLLLSLLTKLCDDRQGEFEKLLLKMRRMAPGAFKLTRRQIMVDLRKKLKGEYEVNNQVPRTEVTVEIQLGRLAVDVAWVCDGTDLVESSDCNAQMLTRCTICNEGRNLEKYLNKLGFV